MRNQKGITLIALVITIIVLLILAGVSIAMLTGQNGILTRATDAQNDTEVAEVVERINMELNAIYSDVLAGQATADFDTDYIEAIDNNLNNMAEAKIEGTVITITGTGEYTDISGNVDISAKTIKAAVMPS